MASKNSVPRDMWEVARLLWENTNKITDADIITQLEVEFGNEVPKSTGTISKRRKKEEWQKNTLPAAAKRKKTQEESGKNRKNSKPKTSNNLPKTNKAQTVEESPHLEEKKALVDGIMDNVVMSAKQRAAIIVKHRKRWKKQGDIQDNVVSLSLSLLDDLDDKDADPETIQKKIAVINILANALDVTTRASKTISEVELPLCGITPEDFSQSDQDRRLGALEALGDIDGQEREARDRLKAELDDRLEWIKETASSGDFGRTPEPDDDGIEEIDYTQVDD
ncbi:hypothetical protein [Psychrobacter aquimaris]|uniref:hypothetical protein n=1 Tax=Psychrobacter aquimaris TaxID=292733 RepID=UPI0018DFD043|nr:hypothetical protein [Psychrobacter aquimaris]